MSEKKINELRKKQEIESSKKYNFDKKRYKREKSKKKRARNKAH